jgi:hypothetical protein
MKLPTNLLLTIVIISLLSFVEAAKKEVYTGPVKFFIFKEHCFEKFLKFDVSDMDCIKFTISKGLGFGIVAGSSILKLPQIIKILSSGSVEGLTPISWYIEVSLVLKLNIIYPNYRQ